MKEEEEGEEKEIEGRSKAIKYRQEESLTKAR